MKTQQKRTARLKMFMLSLKSKGVLSSNSFMGDYQSCGQVLAIQGTLYKHNNKKI